MGKIRFMLFAVDENNQPISMGFDGTDDIFNEGFARVNIGKKWNFIDQEGKLLSDQWFDDVEAFFGGFAAVKLDGERYKIDKNGKLTKI